MYDDRKRIQHCLPNVRSNHNVVIRIESQSSGGIDR